jgi:predicted RNA polymerase sigma factor
VGSTALARSEALARPLGPYALQAAIAACHARARTAEETDWNGSSPSTTRWSEITGSPVVELNRAVAVSMAFGPGPGTRAGRGAERRADAARVPLLPSVRADLLEKLDRLEEAGLEFERAASLAQNARERELLLSRARACGRTVDAGPRA